MAEDKIKLSRFDRVKLLTIKNLCYISCEGDPSQISTGGIWIVLGLVQDSILLGKGSTLIRLPTQDVLKVFDYEDTMKSLYDTLGRVYESGQGQEDDRSDSQ